MGRIRPPTDPERPSERPVEPLVSAPHRGGRWAGDRSQSRLVSEPRPRTYFRSVASASPALDDFASNLQRCRRPRPAELADPLEWAGVSVFDTRAAAAATAQRNPQIGTHVAELRIADAAPTVLRLIVLRTRGPGHYLLLGCAEVLRGFVVDTRPVGG